MASKRQKFVVIESTATARQIEEIRQAFGPLGTRLGNRIHGVKVYGVPTPTGRAGGKQTKMAAAEPDGLSGILIYPTEGGLD